ncbi:sec-independent protein translocase protein TatB [Saccharomonospora amisosensis]|uniref:Sec-independent protein translocase protein TatB n=1 Tax=Saccharomonospora amisosensis TaxID=1128677 RepID=A0A7X5UTM0_9PSEU|nr:Sec-independent protein translocase protein TatB [Saccharomonospora amisosensis]NIJ13968.1 sec-independent protein translocase protein TatB [Saccharomonospora amisosensis]
MFDSIGWGEILVLIIAGLFILGPERLPEAAAWLGRNVRKMRDFATGARQQLRDEMGPEFDEFRKPIEDLRTLRSFDPKRAVTQHLFDGDPDPLGLNSFNGNGNGNGTTEPANGSAKPNGYPAVPQPKSEPLQPGERPPIDPDAT